MAFVRASKTEWGYSGAGGIPLLTLVLPMISVFPLHKMYIVAFDKLPFQN